MFLFILSMAETKIKSNWYVVMNMIMLIMKHSTVYNMVILWIEIYQFIWKLIIDNNSCC